MLRSKLCEPVYSAEQHYRRLSAHNEISQQHARDHGARTARRNRWPPPLKISVNLRLPPKVKKNNRSHSGLESNISWTPHTLPFPKDIVRVMVFNASLPPLSCPLYSVPCSRGGTLFFLSRLCLFVSVLTHLIRVAGRLTPLEAPLSVRPANFQSPRHNGRLSGQDPAPPSPAGNLYGTKALSGMQSACVPLEIRYLRNAS